MKIFNSLEEIKDIEETVVALGNFDGVHRGHQQIIERTVKSAEAAGQNPAVPIPAHIGSLPWNADQNAVPGQGVERHLGDGQRYADFLGIFPRRWKFRAAGEFSAFYLLQNIFPRRLKFV